MKECDFCGKKGNWINVLRDTQIMKKDGSDIILCNDCLNHYANKEYDKIKLKGDVKTSASQTKTKKMKPKTKKIWRKEATIKIKTLLEVTNYRKGCFSNKEKLININIDTVSGSSGCSFPCNKKGKREALKYIKEELYF